MPERWVELYNDAASKCCIVKSEYRKASRVGVKLLASDADLTATMS